ncbi:hypothetical protein BB559_004135 [Furculomyces boomerangus]|uniref:Nudix hydrolase domain-containing protein n=1 Tax=Furculomyces boomerangus TaxID=61424 RepID=A0A2T9YGJ8_9FUNG|nr:hypothetical protein BB559_004135 [Furculomyces boomerangus]
MLKHCPLLSQWSMNPDQVYQSFLKYKFKVPVCGAIILNEHLNKVLLVKGWSSKSSWGFPQGKINKKESEMTCAKREVLEEIGFDISPYISENEWIERVVSEHRVRLYYIPGVKESTVFETKTRKEISEIKWHSILDLLKSKINSSILPEGYKQHTGHKDIKMYLIKPFLLPLYHWINKSISRKNIYNTINLKDSEQTSQNAKRKNTLESKKNYSLFETNSLDNNYSQQQNIVSNNNLFTPVRNIDMPIQPTNLYFQPVISETMNNMMNPELYQPVYPNEELTDPIYNITVDPSFFFGFQEFKLDIPKVMRAYNNYS